MSIKSYGGKTFGGVGSTPLVTEGLRKPYCSNNDKGSTDSSKSVHFNMIHIDPRAGLKCVNDPGILGTFFVTCLALYCNKFYFFHHF